MARTASTTVIAFLLLAAVAASAADPLFPQPLHLTREIEDPVTGRTTTVDEYFSGSRSVSIAGDRTVIVDYAKGETIRIDRAQGTFSIATLDAIARSARVRRPRPAVSAASGWELRPTGSDRRGARDVTLYRAEQHARADSRKSFALEVAIDRSVALTRAGAEVLAGAAYPAERSAEAEAILRAAEGEGAVAAATTGGASAARFGLPLETVLVWSEGEEEVRFVNRVVRVGRELAPVAALEIPRGARRVEDPRVAAAALVEALDRTGAPHD